MAFDINAAKALAVGYKWILLVKFSFLNGDELFVSDQDVTFGAQDYLGVLAEQDLERVQMMSESGVDIPPAMMFHFADANTYVYANYERGVGRGFRGAQVEARLAFYNVLGVEFSTDSIVRFMGVCDPATPVDETRLEVRAQNRLNASKKQLPQFLMQRHCAKIRPKTASQCADATNEDSDFFWCGVTDPGKPDCHNTREGCIAADNLPRFMALTLQPPKEGGTGKEYVSGAQVQLYNAGNDVNYGEPYPMMLGRGWVQVPVFAMVQNGNYTVVEVGLCVDNIDTNYEATLFTRVIANGHEMPPAGYDSGGGFVQLRPGNVGWWNWLTRGHRDGLTVSDVANRHGGKADPYGSVTTLEVTIPRQISSGEQRPTVSVLFSGPKIRVYSDASTYSKAWTDNPAWIMLYLLANSNWRYDELDLASFVSAAAVCDEVVPYDSQYGGLLTHARFKCNLILRQRRSAGEIIRGVRQTANMMLQPNRATGKLSIAIKGTLAAQQPSAVTGSNYTSPVSSQTRGGVSANGYVAYRFTEDNTISVCGVPRPITDTPNRISFQFQDSENNYAPTSLALAETDDVERVGQEVASTVQIDGCANYDQAQRLGQMIHAETHRGNPEGDTRGTQWFEIQAGIGSLRVGVGEICMVNWAKLSLSDQLVRVMGVKGPSKEGLISVTVHWHEDDWYVDANNQRPDPQYSNPRRDMLKRASYPPCPDIVIPRAGGPFYDPSDRTFALLPDWTLGADGRWVGRIRARTKIGVNEFGNVQPPQVQGQANVSSTGGFLEEGTYYIGISAIDAVTGKLSPMSLLSVAIFQPGTTAGVATVPVLWWDDNASGYSKFAGRTPFRLTWQGDDAGTPSSVTFNSYEEARYGAPDQELDAIVLMGKTVHHSGIVGAAVAAVDADEITIGGGWTIDELVDYELSVVAKADGSELPALDYTITGNTTDGILAVDPNPVTDGLAVGDVIVIRSKPTISNGGKTFTDPLWANSFNGGTGLVPDEEIGKVARIIAGTGRGLTNRVYDATSTSHTMANEWLVEPDSTTRIIIEHPEWMPLDAPYRPITNSDPATEIALGFPIENYRRQTMLIGLRTLDGSENPSVDAFVPVRELYIFGEPQGTVLVTSDYTVRREDRTVMVDTTAGPVEIQFLSGAEIAGLSTLIKLVTNGTGDTPPGYDVTILPAAGEDIDGAISVVLDNKNDAERITGSDV